MSTPEHSLKSPKIQISAMIASFWGAYMALLLQYIGGEGLWHGFSWMGVGLWSGRVVLGFVLPILFWISLPLQSTLRWLTWFGLLGIALGFEWFWHTNLILFVLQCIIGTGLSWLFFALTQTQRRTGWRAVLHGLYYAPIMLILIPAACMEWSGGSWGILKEYSSWQLNLWLQLLALPAILLCSACQEFPTRGEGTPMPFDPPKRLVTSGAFAYVANPMQIGKWFLLAGWGLLLVQPSVIGIATLGLLYSILLASPREDKALSKRQKIAWDCYRQEVRRWRFRWRPFHASQYEGNVRPARLYLDLQCDACNNMALWILERNPIGLELLDLQEREHSLPVKQAFNPWEMHYDPNDGSAHESGLIALARGMEHIHLGWAFLAWSIRLPLLSWVFQKIYASAVPAPLVSSAK